MLAHKISSWFSGIGDPIVLTESQFDAGEWVRTTAKINLSQFRNYFRQIAGYVRSVTRKMTDEEKVSVAELLGPDKKSE
jgi:hypothetical protein